MRSKLWLLKPVSGLGHKDPWAHQGKDVADGFVIRAKSEERARQIAAANGADETDRNGGKSPWLDASLATCEAIDPSGAEGIILTDFSAA